MSSLPRVLLVGPTPPPVGGMASVVEDCRRVIAASGIYEALIVEVKHSGSRSLGAFNLTNLSLNLRLYNMLRRELRQSPAPIVHMHASVSTRTTVLKHLLLARAVRRSGAKLLLQPHSGAIAELLRSGSSRWRAELGKLLHLADVVLASSPYWVELLGAEWPGLPLSLLPNGVDVNYYRPAERSSTAGRPLRVIFLGHLTAYKGLAELRDAWQALLPSTQGSPELHLVGEARDEGGRELAAELAALPGVTMHGLVGNERKLELLQSSDIFVLPSHYENLPISLLEAMACGLACIASRSGAIPELLRDGCGITVEPRDAAGLAAALAGLIADAESLPEMGLRARQRVVAEYSMEHFSSELLGLYSRYSG